MGLSLRELERADRTIDLGPLQPGQLPRRLFTKGKRILLAPEPILADLQRVDARFSRAPAAEQLVLIGRRQLRDNNSWMHNVPRLMKGRNRCTLWINPIEAARHGLTDGQQVVIRSSVGTLQAPLQVTDQIREGVVSLPHGYGHGRDGTRLTVANANPGVCINDITDHRPLDRAVWDKRNERRAGHRRSGPARTGSQLSGSGNAEGGEPGTDRPDQGARSARGCRAPGQGRPNPKLPRQKRANPC